MHTAAAIRLELLAGFLTFALWVYCLVGVITTPDPQSRNLPKVAWLLIVPFIPLVGSVAWLVAGRPRAAQGRPGARERPTPAYPGYDRPGRAAALDVNADEEFLKGVRARAEEQRTRHEQSRRERKRQAEEERQRYRSRPRVSDATPEDV